MEVTWKLEAKLRLNVSTPLEELKERIAHHADKVLVIAGAGIACATDNSPCSGWIGLLRDGVEYCRSHCNHLNDKWYDVTIGTIEERSTDSLVQAATRIVKALEKLHAGEVGKWLAESIGGLSLKQREVIDGLLTLGCRIATTNYDNLFEDASDLDPLVWSDSGRAIAFLRSESDGILHLHGHYKSPGTVVLNAETYENVCRDEATQNSLRSIFTMHTVVFVGCGAGVDDPNFGKLFEWSRGPLKHCLHRHYFIARDGEVKSASERFEGLPISVVSYGKEYIELAPFLNEIAKYAQQARSTTLPADRLVSIQADYEQIVQGLAAEKDISPIELVNRNFAVAKRLWDAGGHRTAALHMHSIIQKNGTALPEIARVELTFEAMEYLLEDRLDFFAGLLLESLTPLVNQGTLNEGLVSKYHELATRCMKAAADWSGLKRAIEQRLNGSDDLKKEILEAEIFELHMMSGDWDSIESRLKTDGGC